MRSDDLAPLFGRRPPAGVGFRQGTVLAWDPQTADNAIEVGGSVFTNLTTLNGAEVAVIKPGDKVSILTLGEGAKTWFVVGRMTIPGGAEASIVRSADYQAGTAGYTVNRDGSAEFQDLTARGDLTVNSLLAGTPGGARVELTPANFIKVYNSSNQLVVSITDQQMFLFGLNNSFARLLPDNGNFNSPRLELKPQPDPGFSTVVNAGGLVQASGLAGVPRLFLTSPIIDGVANTATINVYSGYSGHPDTLIFLQADLVQVGTDLTVIGVIKWGATPAIAVAARDAAAGAVGTTTSDTHGNTLTGLAVMGVSFVAPPSGRVSVSIKSEAGCAVLNNYAGISFEIRSGGTVGSGSVFQSANTDTEAISRSTGVANSDQVVAMMDLVSGLTPGTTYNACITYRSLTLGNQSRFSRRVIVVRPEL